MTYYEKVPSDAELESTPLASVRVRTAAPLASVRAMTVLVCLLYAVVGPTLVLVNNHILKSLHFPFPLFLSALGLVTTSLVCVFMLHVLPRLRRAARKRLVPMGARSTAKEPESPAHALQPPGLLGDGLNADIRFDFWLRNMVPIGAAQGLTFASTNAAYMYLTITFTQVCARARAPPPPPHSPFAPPTEKIAPSPFLCRCRWCARRPVRRWGRCWPRSRQWSHCCCCMSAAWRCQPPTRVSPYAASITPALGSRNAWLAHPLRPSTGLVGPALAAVHARRQRG